MFLVPRSNPNHWDPDVVIHIDIDQQPSALQSFVLYSLIFITLFCDSQQHCALAVWFTDIMRSYLHLLLALLALLSISSAVHTTDEEGEYIHEEASSTAGGDKPKILAPALHWDTNVYDYTHFSPATALNLFYGEQNRDTSAGGK